MRDFILTEVERNCITIASSAELSLPNGFSYLKKDAKMQTMHHPPTHQLFAKNRGSCSPRS